MSFALFVLASCAIAVATVVSARALRGRPGLAVLAAFAGATGLVLVHGPLYFDYYADDSFITLRYAKHLAEGLGPNWNSDGRVEGYTTFLWMGTLGGFAKLGADLVQVSRLLGFFAIVATFFGVYKIWQLWGDDEPGGALQSPVLLAAVLLGLALTDGVAFWGFSGMETPLFMALLTIGAYLHFRERRGSAVPWSAFVFAAAAMTRPEGLIAAGVTVAFVASELATAHDRRTALRRLALWAGVFVALYGTYFIWRFSYYGYLLPNTYYAKVGLNLDALDRGLRYLSTSGLQYHLGVLFVGAALLFADVRRRPEAAYVVALCGVLLAAVALEGGDTHGRFIVPLLPLLLLAGLAGFAMLLERAKLQPAHALVITTAALSFGGLALLPASDDPVVRLWPRALEERRELGVWLNDNTPADFTIADFAVGATAYYASDRDVLDLLGLNDVVIAHTDVPDMGKGIVGHERYNADYVFDEVRPEIVVLGQPYTRPLTKEELQEGVRKTSLFAASYVILTDARLWESYEVRALFTGGRWVHFMQLQETVAQLQGPRLH
ncbi:MAG: hypothetical protein WD939_03265 [Dehalococcoidia bacterium]